MYLNLIHSFKCPLFSDNLVPEVDDQDLNKKERITPLIFFQQPSQQRPLTANELILLKYETLIVRKFLDIFNIKISPKIKDLRELVPSIFNKYIGRESHSIQIKQVEGISRLEINSMEPIINYIEDHPEIKSCNFRRGKFNRRDFSFTGNGRSSIGDIATLAKYLKTPLCEISALVFNMILPKEDKEHLEEAVLARKNSDRLLRVHYY